MIRKNPTQKKKMEKKTLTEGFQIEENGIEQEQREWELDKSNKLNLYHNKELGFEEKERRESPLD